MRDRSSRAHDRRGGSLCRAVFAGWLPVAVLVVISGCGGPRVAGVELSEVREEFRRVTEETLWPGFRPRDIPAVMADGRRTFLFGHSDPPPGFGAVRGSAGTWVLDSVSPAVRANTSIELAGVETAALWLDPSRTWTAREIALLWVHEAFHVFQAAHHPDWTANEVELFTYPFDDVEILRLRRLETTAWRRAVEAPDSLKRVCWTREAVRVHERRMARLPGGSADWERGTELREGLARYVEAIADGGRPPALPAEGFAPSEVRTRAYAIGHAIAYVLDRLSETWKAQVAGEPLEQVAARAAAGGEPVRPCRLSPDEWGRAATVARADVAEERRRREAARRRFLERPGWRVQVLSSAGSPLFPSAFDPLNVEVLDPASVLHRRWLKLSNRAAELEVLGVEALTEAAGSHPLFEGVARLTVTGLEEEPAIESRADTLWLRAAGVNLRARGAGWERGERGIVIRLPEGG